MNKIKSRLFYSASLLLCLASFSLFAQSITEEEAPYPDVVPLALPEDRPGLELEEIVKRDQAILKKRHLKELRTSNYLQHRELISELVNLRRGERLYRAKEGETLIWIAFKLYGDYRMWRYLKQNNFRNFAYGIRIYGGMGLYYLPPKKGYKEPSGLPYFIKEGDYLEGIATQVYGNPKVWKSIHRHNKRQIQNPDLILDGFTLFYRPASEIAGALKSAGDWTVEDFNHYTGIQNYVPKIVYIKPHQEAVVGTSEFKELEELPDVMDVYGQIVQEVNSEKAAQERDEDLEPQNDPPIVFLAD